MRAWVWVGGFAAWAAGCSGGDADSRGDGAPIVTDTSGGETTGTGSTTGGSATSGPTVTSDAPPTTDATSEGEGGSTSTGGTTGSSSSSGEASSSGGGSSEEATGAGVCGDGAVDGGEACDDGNLADGDGCNADCQPSGRLLWSTSHGGGLKLADEALGCAVDGFGSIYVAGFTTLSKTDEDVWARSYTAEGAIVWTQTYAGALGLKDRGQAIVVDAAQLVYIAGYENIDMQANDVWLRKLAADGMPVWTRGYNGPASASDAVYGATLTAAGDLLVVGAHNVVGQGLDLWLRKYDAAGATLWTRTKAGPAAKGDIGRTVAEAPDGSIFVAGEEVVDLEAANAWVGRYDADGNLLWARLYNGAASLDDILYGAVATADGGVVVCGTEKSVAVPVLSFTRKYDAAGLMVWTDRDDGADDAGASCYGVDLAADGDVLLAGSSVDAGAQTRPRVRRLAGDGAERWSTTIAGAGTAASQARCVRPAPDGTIVAAGGLDDGVDGRDLWIGRLSP